MAKYGSGASQEDLQRALSFEKEIRANAQKWGIPAALIAAIGSRESRWRPEFFIGDGGHGHGPLQVDDGKRKGQRGEHASWCEWWDALWAKGEPSAVGAGIDKGLEIFSAGHSSLWRRELTEPVLTRAAVAAYNTGEGNVLRSLSKRIDVDSTTTGQNYSADVLARFEFFTLHGFMEV